MEADKRAALLARLDEIEAFARHPDGSGYIGFSEGPPLAAFVVAHDPETVLRQVAGVPDASVAVPDSCRSVRRVLRGGVVTTDRHEPSYEPFVGSLTLAREARPRALKRGAILRVTRQGETTTFRVLSVRPLRSGALNVRLEQVTS